MGAEPRPFVRAARSAWEPLPSRPLPAEARPSGAPAEAEALSIGLAGEAARWLWLEPPLQRYCYEQGAAAAPTAR